MIKNQILTPSRFAYGIAMVARPGLSAHRVIGEILQPPRTERGYTTRHCASVFPYVQTHFFCNYNFYREHLEYQPRFIATNIMT